MFAKRYLYIAKANLRFNLYPYVLLSILFLYISPLVMGVENLDWIRTAQVLEMYVALLGIILFVPIFYPEQNKEIRDLIEAKDTPLTSIYMVRIVEAVFILAIMVGIYVYLLANHNCTFSESKYYLGTMAEAIYLGGMGLLSYSIFDQITIAYMVPLVYYVMNISLGSKYFNNFYLLSMMKGSYKEKVYLAIAGGIFLILGLGYRHFVRRLH